MAKKTVFVTMAVIALIIGFSAICNASIPIGEEDMLLISVWDHPELTVNVPVRPGGVISVPFVGEVTASGLSPQELKALLEKDFSQFIKLPSVSVVVTAVNSFKVYILGSGIRGGAPETVPGVSTGAAAGAAAGVSQGAATGVISLKRDTSVLQFISQISLRKDADLKKAYLMRDGKKLGVDFYKLVVKGDTAQDIQLRPNDVIFIPEDLEQSIRVVGAVKTPGIIPYTDGITALDAVLSVGGFTDYASQNNVLVVRKEGNEVINIRVQLKDVIRDGDTSKNLLLKPGDIVNVKSSIF